MTSCKLNVVVLQKGRIMIIQCTKKLLDRLELDNMNLVPAEGYDIYPDNFYAWHANLVSINRRKAIIFMNNLTRYTIERLVWEIV